MSNRGPTWKSQYDKGPNHHHKGGGGGGHRGRGGGFKNKSWKRGGGGGGSKQDWASRVRNQLLDEDTDMEPTYSGLNRQQTRSWKGKNSGPGHSKSGEGNRRKLLENPIGWYRVTLPFGNKYEKSFVVALLLKEVSDVGPFWPYAWSTSGNAVSFFVDNYPVADKLNSLSHRIQTPDGFRLIIHVMTGLPSFQIDDKYKEKIRTVMAKRYNKETKALNLKEFHRDADLQDTFGALFKPIILQAVIQIITENIPDIEALDISDNRIATLGHLKNTTNRFKHLRVLHMANNKLRDLYSLDVLIGAPITELVLSGNPLCLKYKEQETYAGEVRKSFPKLLKLDGIELPRPIGFDIATDITTLPQMHQTYLCSADGELIVSRFLKQYYVIYDTENRLPLSQAYHADAAFSLTVAYPYGHQKDRGSSWLNWYMTESRNLKRLNDPNRRIKLLRHGQTDIVQYLNQMPLTRHDIHSFTVDLTVFTPHMLSVTITGLFKELKSGHKSPPIRSFMRTLVIVPAGTGFCIVNDMLHVTNSTDDQINMQSTSAPTSQVSSPATPSQMGHAHSLSASASPITPLAVIPDGNIRQQMIQTLSQQSGMNLEWSEKCLSETLWDFDKAATVFDNLNKQGVIPAEAFVK